MVEVVSVSVVGVACEGFCLPLFVSHWAGGLGLAICLCSLWNVM